MLFVILYCWLQGKCMDEFLPQCILFFRKWLWIKQHDLFSTKIDKFNLVFKESCCLLSTNLKRVMDAFFTKEFTESIKNGEMT